MKNQTNEIRVINRRKNGEEFDPAGFVLPYEITKALIEAVTLPAFVGRSSQIGEEARP